jgi:DNA-binding transcriptional regulator YiaG
MSKNLDFPKIQLYICTTSLLTKYSKMKITESTISKIRTNVRVKNRLALALDCSVPTVERWIKENESNGDLTKATAVQIISEETDLTQGEILEEGKEEPELSRKDTAA